MLPSKRVAQKKKKKKKKATGDLTGNKIADKITSAGKTNNTKKTKH